MQVIQTGSTLKVTFTEPSTNDDGTPLTDLSVTEITADYGSGTPVVVPVPASSPTGGVEKSVDVNVPNVGGNVINVSVVAHSLDLTGNKSKPGPVVNLTIDTLAPAPPQ